MDMSSWSLLHYLLYALYPSLLRVCNLSRFRNGKDVCHKEIERERKRERVGMEKRLIFKL
jgi:hypothetical protein